MTSQGVIEKRTPRTEARIKIIAESTTAGIWRIKRAKVILGLWAGMSVDELVLDVRVPPESVIKCRNEFAVRGLAYFDEPSRKQTARESRVERVLEFLNDPPHPRADKWQQLTVHYIGRDFTAREIWKLRDFIDSHPKACRAWIAKHLCEMCDLYQRDGKIKKSTAFHIIKRMAMDNIIRLPEIPRIKHSKAERKSLILEPFENLELRQDEIPILRFVLVDNAKQSALWREMIERFHYIKVSRIFGAQLRYLVYGGNNEDVLDDKHLLAALAFGPCALSLASRDNYIGWPSALREKNLHLIVNNVRFLILPWIKSNNLASRILGGIVRRLPSDWEKRYHYRPVLLETFVQSNLHRGTSYRAANWICVGITDGYSLYSSRRGSVPEKTIFIYPLRRNFRRILNTA